MMKLGYCYVAWFFQPASVNAIPRFLLAGQSNMEGHGGVDLSVFNGTMDILFDTTVDEVISSNLKQHLSSYSSSPPTSEERYGFMAAYLLDLKNRDILTDDIHNYQADIDCSFLSLDINSPDSGPVALAEDMPLSPGSGCGRSFGPELMFGHVMKKQFFGPGTRFALDKITAGGSEIQYHWSKDIGDGTPGKFWDDLLDRIQDIDIANDHWAGIAWFQGENTVFRNSNSTAVSLSQQEKDEIDAKVIQYQQNLLDFVKDTRQEVYDVDPSMYSSPDVIPFAIIQLGCWIREYNDNGLTVFTAQQAVADNDPNIVLVDSYHSLSCHYHLDDPSQLIIGHRLAVQMQTLLKSPKKNLFHYSSEFEGGQ